jgi:Cu(I)/Ag(I) efflux system membrane fusion protein
MSDAIAGESAVSGAYTCSMHPEVRVAQPGRCPICGMELIRRP